MNKSAQAVLVVTILSAAFSACGSGQTLRERERQQQLEDAAKKTKEMKLIEGRYVGNLSFDETDRSHGRSQLVDLELHVVSDVTQMGNQVDPMLMPRFSGKFDLVFGTSVNERFIRFPITQADYNPATSEVVLVSKDSRVKLIGTVEGDVFRGEWISDETGHVGHFALSKNRGGALVSRDGYNSDVPALDGVYLGDLKADTGSFPSTLKLHSVRRLQDEISTDLRGFNFSVEGTLRLTVGNDPERDYLYYELGGMNYDYTTGRIVFQSKDGQVSLDGFLTPRGLSFSWISKSRGERWSVEYERVSQLDGKGGKDKVSEKPGASPLPVVSGTYFGILEDAKSRIPWQMALTLSRENVEPDLPGNGAKPSLKLTAGVVVKRDWLEERFFFPGINYDHFSGRIFLTGQEGSLISGAIDSAGNFSGEWVLPTGERFGAFELNLSAGSVRPELPSFWIVLSSAEIASEGKVVKVRPGAREGILFEGVAKPGTGYSEIVESISLGNSRMLALWRMRHEAPSEGGTRIVLHDLIWDRAEVLHQSDHGITDLKYDSASGAAFWVSKEREDAGLQYGIFRLHGSKVEKIENWKVPLRILAALGNGELLIGEGHSGEVSWVAYSHSSKARRTLSAFLAEWPKQMRSFGSEVIWVDSSGQLFAQRFGESASEQRQLNSPDERVVEIGEVSSGGLVPVVLNTIRGPVVRIWNLGDMATAGRSFAIRSLHQRVGERQHCPVIDESSQSLFFVESDLSGAASSLIRVALEDGGSVRMTSQVAFERWNCPRLVRAN